MGRTFSRQPAAYAAAAAAARAHALDVKIASARVLRRLQHFTSFTITGSQARRHRDARVLDSWCLLGSVSSEKESECAWWRRSLNQRPNQPTAVSCRLPKALHRPPRFCCLHLLQEAQTCRSAVSVFQLIQDCRLLHMPLAYVSLITTVWT